MKAVEDMTLEELRSAVEEMRLARVRLIEPNKWSDLKIEKYVFGMEFELILGKPCQLAGIAAPDTIFRISDIETNVPCPNFARTTDIRVANVTGVCVGGPTGTHVISLIERPVLGKREMVKVDSGPSSDVMPTVMSKSGAIDLWNLRGKGVVDLPTLTPANSVGFYGFYDGKVPAGYEKGEIFRLSVMFGGNANIVA